MFCHACAEDTLGCRAGGDVALGEASLTNHLLGIPDRPLQVLFAVEFSKEKRQLTTRATTKKTQIA